MSHLFRKGDGEPIRAAMHRKGLSGPRLAEATKHFDPDGKGISPAAVGRIAGQGETSRDRCHLKSAWFIASALEEPLQDLFDLVAPANSTSKIERSNHDAYEG